MESKGKNVVLVTLYAIKAYGAERMYCFTQSYLDIRKGV